MQEREQVVIEVRDLRKSFRVRQGNTGLRRSPLGFIRPRRAVIEALNGIDFTVCRGEIVGYIGPNGAGKSTTIKIMSGILVPDSGSCLVKGLCPWRQRIRHVSGIGVVFGQRSQLWPEVPVADSFALLGDIYRVDRARLRERQARLSSELGLEGLLSCPARHLSLGQRMRCEIAASLLHEPDILFLDEPTIGLDAVSKLAVRDFILRENSQRALTVILTTHDMHDIEALTSRVILIGKGSILFDGGLEALLAGRDSLGLEAALAGLYGELGIA